jgi:hypothetical protein
VPASTNLRLPATSRAVPRAQKFDLPASQLIFRFGADSVFAGGFEFALRDVLSERSGRPPELCEGDVLGAAHGQELAAPAGEDLDVVRGELGWEPLGLRGDLVLGKHEGAADPTVGASQDDPPGVGLGVVFPGEVEGALDNGCLNRKLRELPGLLLGMELCLRPPPTAAQAGRFRLRLPGPARLLAPLSHGTDPLEGIVSTACPASGLVSLRSCVRDLDRRGEPCPAGRDGLSPIRAPPPDPLAEGVGPRAALLRGKTPEASRIGPKCRCAFLARVWVVVSGRPGTDLGFDGRKQEGTEPCSRTWSRFPAFSDSGSHATGRS